MYAYDPFWVNFCVLCKIKAKISFFPSDIQLFQHHLLNRLPFSHWTAMTHTHTQKQIYLPFMCRSISGLSIYLHIYCFSAHCLDFLSYNMCYSKAVKILLCSFSKLFINLYYIHQHLLWVGLNCIESIYQLEELGRNFIFTVLILPIWGMHITRLV